MRIPQSLAPACAFAMVVAGGATAEAATSSRSVPSAFSTNGHNISFDGRVLIGRTTPGWMVFIFRPEAVTYGADGLPVAEGMFSSPVLILTGPDPDTLGENALAICEPDHARAPYRCNEAGADDAAGPYDCYDVWIFDSNALNPAQSGGPTFRRRHLTLWIADPKTKTAALHKWSWDGAIELLATSDSGQLKGIEATVTSDGKLMVWNGTTTAANDAQRTNESLAYSTNPTPCAGTGWAPQQPISHMVNDPATRGHYRLAERTLRAADGTRFADGDPIPGAYPWLLPSGEAVIFQAANMPCRTEMDPPGCGPRRNQTSVLGYPTNWGLAVIDGGVNPDTDQTVRLFFSSPGPKTFPQLPVTKGKDVWPFFGSNTHNYVEISFDDGLDGNYAGLWHMNESVTPGGGLDVSTVSDVSGYFNTARIPWRQPDRNLLGGAVDFNGTGGAVTIASDASTRPTQRVNLELAIKPAAAANCDANDNWRVLLHRGDLGGGEYLVTYNDTGTVGVRFNPVGTHDYWVGTNNPIAIGQVTRIAATYDATTGVAEMYVNGHFEMRNSYPPAPLPGSSEPLIVGGPGGTTAACPAGAGTFKGTLDLLDLSTHAVPPLGATFPGANNGILGKAVELNGTDGHLEVANAASLSPVNAITMEMAVKPAADPDCDDKNNYRVLLSKGSAYNLTFEETRGVRARVQVTGGMIYDVYSGATLPVGAWSRVAATYDGATGDMAIFIDGKEASRTTHTPATLLANTEPLTIGGPAAARPACPDGEGAFQGAIDEVAVSRVVRSIAPPPPPPDAGLPPDDASLPPPLPDAGSHPPPAMESGGGGGCSVRGAPAGSYALIVLAGLLFLALRRRR